jgi:transposase
MEALKRDVELYPDAYHYERAVRFGITESGIRSALKRLGISYKKKRCNIPKPMKTHDKPSKPE